MSLPHLDDHVASYLQLQRQTLGKSYVDEAKVLRKFACFVASHTHLGPVTQELVVAFATDSLGRSPARSWKRYNVVRHFARYLAIFVPGTSTLDPRVLRRHRTRPIPFIFTDDEITRLLREARHPRKSQISAATHYAVFGLAVSTGMRLGEVTSLDSSDVDLEAAVLTVRNTKFRKDRLVPIHATTVAALREYATLRSEAFAAKSLAAFFVSTTRRDRYSKDSLSLAFAGISQRAGLRRPDGQEPTFHSLRHTFAVRRLIEWYREDVDVQAMLPVLATYMGHVNYTSTEYYLTATPDLLVLAAERDARRRAGSPHA